MQEIVNEAEILGRELGPEFKRKFIVSNVKGFHPDWVIPPLSEESRLTAIDYHPDFTQKYNSDISVFEHVKEWFSSLSLTGVAIQARLVTKPAM